MITWEDKYSVNISMLDEEHKKIITKVNAVTVADWHNYTLEKIAEIINDMITYVRKHFKSEEDYMIKFKYPAYQSHKEEHDKFLERITFYYDRLILNDYIVENNIFDILKHFKQWLIDHIQVTDKGYTDCFNNNGLK
jgi:hemerythrin